MHCVYVLQSPKDHGWYIGSTSDIGRRVKDHNYGKVKSTKFRRPLELIHFE
ncbi:MAG: GIY-YIG nuclease family protein, partial [Candidatus Berkelbacteria bacterium]|nr:GIY-YIG nuclease family protein [Candidatus Berkelbacteria bacterium]